MSGNFRHKSHLQHQSLGVGAGSFLISTHPQQQQQATQAPALPQHTTDVKAEEPPLVTVTSDLPEYGGSPSPRPSERQAPVKSPLQAQTAQRAAGSTTPGRARLEVVLNVSPHKISPGQIVWTEADVDDDKQDELVKAGVVSSRKRKAPHTLANPSSNLEAKSSASSTPVPGKRSRGRPKGWRPGMPSTKTGQPTASAFRYLDKDGNRIPPPPSSAAPKSTGPKRRGRPPRAPSPTPREVWESLVPPEYVPFICEWKGCKAELQNMDTLRRHLRKLHGLEHDGVVCRWGACDRQVQCGEQQIFTPDEFHEHMEEQHLVPFLWHVGDGVRNEKLISIKLPTKDDDKAPAYLLGPNGEQVTPWVKGQEVEDFLTWRENRNRLKQILLQRDQNAPSEEEEEEEEEEEDDDKEADGTPLPV